MMSRWAIMGREPKLMVSQSGGLETGASLGKCISCSQMWNSYFSSNEGDLKEGPIPDVTQGSGAELCRARYPVLIQFLSQSQWLCPGCFLKSPKR